MSAPDQTLNVTVSQVEDALLAGATVPDFAREWSEPRANVLAIYRRLQEEGRLPKHGPSQVASSRTLTSVPMPAHTASTTVAPALDALIAAAARSTSKRTRTLGARLNDLAADVRQRLADERAAAEKAERDKRVRDEAAAKVAALEAELAEARKALGSKRTTRTGAPSRRGTGHVLSDEQKAKMRAGQVNTEPCAKGCGTVAKTKSGKAAHERHCGTTP